MPHDRRAPKRDTRVSALRLPPHNVTVLTGNHGVLLTVVDGRHGGGGVDTFRITIWDVATGVVNYDKAVSTSDRIGRLNPRARGSGSIVIDARGY